MLMTRLSTDVVGSRAYLRDLLAWSLIWLFVVCNAYTLWHLASWVIR